MTVDINKAQSYLGSKPLTLSQIKMLRGLLEPKNWKQRLAKKMIEKQSGKMTVEDENNLKAYLDQEEERLREKKN